MIDEPSHAGLLDFKLLEHLPLGICVCDHEFTIRYWNKTLESWTRKPKEDIIGLNLIEQYPHLREPKYYNRLSQVASGGPAAVFSSQLHPHFIYSPLSDGTMRIQHTTVNSVRNDFDELLLLISVQDMTDSTRFVERIKNLRKQALDEVSERVKAEEALRESEEKYRQLFKNSPLGVFHFDDTGIITDANEAFSHIFNIKVEDVIGLHALKLSNQALVETISEALKGHVSHFEGPYQVLDDENQKIVKIDFAPIFLGDDRVIGGVGIVEDISDRIRVQRELKSSKEMLDSINRNISEGLFRLVPGSGLIYLNNAFTQLFGYRTTDEFLGKDFTELVVNQEKQKQLNAIIDLVGYFVNEEVEFYRKDGSRFWALISANAMRNTKGGISHIDGAISDITERKRQLEKIRESEEQYRNLFQNSMVGMFRFRTSNGDIMNVNPKGLEIFGYDSLEDIREGKLYNNYQDWLDLQKLIMENGILNNLELQARRKDGSSVWLSASARLYPNEDYFEGVIVNIDERKKAELRQEVLYRIAEKSNSAKDILKFYREIHQEISRLMDASNFYIAECNPQRGTTTFPYIIDEFEKDVEEVKFGKGLTEYVFYGGRPLLAPWPQIQELIDTGEITPRGPDCKIWLGVPVKTVSETLGVIAVQTYRENVTFTLQDQEILTFVSQHVGAVMERKRNEENLLRAKEEAEAACRTKSLFLANMSHELRTPLNSIIGFTRRVLKRAGDKLDQQSIDGLETVQRNSKSLLQLINDILDLSKVEAGKLSYNLQSVALDDICRDLAMEMEPIATGKELYVRVGAPSGVIARCDAARLRQIVVNIIGNGIKFTDEGGILLSTGITTHHHRNMAYIAISDTGIGIPPDKRESIFNVFEQVDALRDQAKGGTGLGLAISMKITKEMGGTILVDSDLHKGSTFKVLLPLQAEPFDIL